MIRHRVGLEVDCQPDRQALALTCTAGRLRPDRAPKKPEEIYISERRLGMDELDMRRNTDSDLGCDGVLASAMHCRGHESLPCPWVERLV